MYVCMYVCMYVYMYECRPLYVCQYVDCVCIYCIYVYIIIRPIYLLIRIHFTMHSTSKLCMYVQNKVNSNDILLSKLVVKLVVKLLVKLVVKLVVRRSEVKQIQ